MTDIRALPTEPLLDDPCAGIPRWNTPPEIRRWIDELAGEADTNARSSLLFQSLRKQTDGPLFVGMGRGLLASATRGEVSGVAVMAGFLAVSTPGETLIERVREFSNTHREVLRIRRELDEGVAVGKAETTLLENFEAADQRLAERWSEPPADARMRDRGPAWRLRRAFGSVVAELEATGNLGPDALELLLRLARVETSALELRASALAGAINPYSARHVSQVMPILGAVDTDLRDMRRFLEELESHRRVSLFHRQIPAIVEHLEESDERRIRERLQQEESLQILWRLLRGLDRNPLPQRALAWFTDRVLAMGEVLVEKGHRRSPMDVVAAVLCVLDLHRDGVLQMHASTAVRRALAEAALDGVEIGDGSVRVVLDPVAARRMVTPHGLPLPTALETGADDKPEEQSVKELVSANINNTSVLLGLLKNQKVVNTPGVVAMVASRTRNMRVLDIICATRTLHSGFANKDVPLAILRSPMNIPVKTLRKFINVRYVSKMDLRRMAVDRSATRREVASEIEAYLKSLN